MTHTITYYDCASYLQRRGYLLEWPAARAITIATIQARVAEHFGLPVRIMKDACRRREYARPRQIAMYLSKLLTCQSLPQIGNRFGGRDHTTVIHAIRRIEALRLGDPEIRASVDYITAELGGA